jgi:hypothetical protein
MAQSKREYLTKLIMQAFEGSEHLTPELFWQMFYCFQEKKSECGKLLAEEEKSSNSCMLIIEGACNVYKHKNVVKPFKVWRESLDSTTKTKHSAIMDSYQDSILAITANVVKVATIGPGELIGAETLLAAGLLLQPKHTDSRKANPRLTEGKLELVKPDGISLFTVEVSSPTLEYLHISKSSFRKFLKGFIRTNLISRFFYNLDHRNRLIQTKNLGDPNSRPLDYVARCAGESSRLEAVRLQVYRANERLVQSVKDADHDRDSPNKRGKWISMYRRLTMIQKYAQIEDFTPVDEKIYKELNDRRINMRKAFHTHGNSKEVRMGPVRIRATSLDNIAINNESYCKTTKNKRDLSIHSSAYCDRIDLSPKLNAERPISGFNIMSITGSLNKKYGQTERSVSICLEDPIANSKPPIASYKESSALMTVGSLKKKPPSHLLDTFFKRLANGSLKTAIDPHDIKLNKNARNICSVLETKANIETDRSLEQSIKFKNLRSPSQQGNSYCRRELDRLTASRSVRRQRETFHMEQSAFNQRQSAHTARKAINLIQRQRRSGKDISVLFTQPVVHLSAVYT